MAITLRGSSIAYINAASSGTFALPAGAQAGDVCYVFGGHGFAFSSVQSGSGGAWYQVDRLDGSGYNGAVYVKVLTAADIVSGTLTVGFSGGYYGTVAAVAFVGSAATVRTFASYRNSAGAASRTATTDATPQVGDFAIFFGAGRANGAVTSSGGAGLQTQNALESSGVLASGGLLGSAGAVSNTFNYSVVPSADYGVVLIVREVAPISPNMGYDPSPQRKSNQTLSNFGAKATSTGAGGVELQRVIQGKTYVEFTPSVITGTPNVGFVSGGWLGNTSLTSGIDRIGYLPSGAVQVNGVTLQTISAYAAGNRIDMAINPLNRLVWFRVSGGNWNNSGTADPATDTGGIDYSSALTGGGTLVPAVYASLTGTVWDVTSDAALFAGVPPSGYSDLSVVQYTRAQTTQPGNAPVGPVVALPTPGGVFAPLMPNGSNGKTFSPAGPVTVVSGTTKEAGVIVTGKVVEVYDRDTGDLLGRTKSDAMGNWSIPALGRPAVRVVGSDPTTYNSLVYDNVVPV